MRAIYCYIGYTNYCPLKYNNIGYYKPKVGHVNEYRSSKNGQYSTVKGPWLCLGPVTMEYRPFFSDLYSVTQHTFGVQYHIHCTLYFLLNSRNGN